MTHKLIGSNILRSDKPFSFEEGIIYDPDLDTEYRRLNLLTGNSVSTLVYNVDSDTVVLCEQFRFSASRNVEHPNRWDPLKVIECPAGGCGRQENIYQAAARELLEETGYKIHPARLQLIGSFFLSPGTISEKNHIFVGAVSYTDRENVSNVQGLAEEDEYITIGHFSLEEALSICKDAKTMIGLQWIQANLSQLLDMYRPEESNLPQI